MTDVISIQSQVVHGHVGNSAAVFPMQVKGLEVAGVPTTLLSNHPHYSTVRGQVLDAGLVADLLLGVEERGLVDTARFVITGYLGSVANGLAVANFIRRARQRNPRLAYVCDPVMGDDDLGLFVKAGLVDVFREELVPQSDVITPNQYELELLAREKARSLEGLADAVAKLRERGTVSAAVTGCVLDDSPERCVETVTWTARGIGRTSVRRLPIRPCGTGDLFTALLVSQMHGGGDLTQAAAEATSETWAVLDRTQAEQGDEMKIVGFPFASAIKPQDNRTSVSGETS